MTKTELVQSECARRGLKISSFGSGFRIHGKQVDILVAGIRFINRGDLDPARHELLRFPKQTLKGKS